MKNGTQRCWSRWVLMRSTHSRVKSALMMHNCAYCPYLNSTALPGCNHSPGTVRANSSLTANVPFTLPHGVGWWATLAHSESRQCVHDHKGSNTRISGYSSARAPVTLLQKAKASRHGVWPKYSQLRKPEEGQPCWTEIAAGPRGTSRCRNENSHCHCQHWHSNSVLINALYL